MKETQERRDAEMRALQKDLLEYKEQMKNSLEEVGNACSFFQHDIHDASSKLLLQSEILDNTINSNMRKN